MSGVHHKHASKHPAASQFSLDFEAAATAPSAAPPVDASGDEPAPAQRVALETLTVETVPVERAAHETAAAVPLAAPALLRILADWVDAGWLRALDLALARWLHEQVPASPPELLLLAALLSQREGRGHGALRLSDLVGEGTASSPVATPGDWLDGPAAAEAALDAVLGGLPGDAAAWVQALAASPAVTCRADAIAPTRPAAPGIPRTPLVFEHGLLYLRRHWREERAVAARVLARVSPAAMAHAPLKPPTSVSTPSAAEGVDPATVRRWLDRLFGPLTAPPASAGTPTLPDPDWQRVACAVALRGRLTLITGGPGTGKTYTVARLLALRFALHPNPQQLRIALAAPTGKAAARLKQSIDQALDALRAALPEALDWALLAQRLAVAWTLHKLLGARPDTRRLRHHAGHPLEVDLLVVDEASMVHLEMMDALLEALPASAQLVLLGDRDQLASVEAGAVLGDLCGDGLPVANAATRDWIEACTGQTVPAPAGVQEGPPLSQHTVMLRLSRRFDGPIGALAVAVNAGDVGTARQLLAAGTRDPAAPVRWVVPAQVDDVLRLALLGHAGAAPVAEGSAQDLAGTSGGGLLDSLALLPERPTSPDVTAHEAWVRRVLAAFDRQRLLCALREGDWGVSGVNRRVEQALRERGAIARSGEWYEGRPVMVTRNDAALGVFNGDLGVTLRGAGPAAALRVWFQDGERLRSVLASRLSAVETAYAMTVHKSQGSEFAHTVLVLPPFANSVLTRELVYTGITRARQRFTLVAPEAAVFDAALRRRTVRVSGLAWRLRDAAGS